MANPAPKIRMNDGRLRCAGCGMPYASESWSDFVIPDEAWERISSDSNGGGVLCVQCMIDRANAAGVSCVGQFTSGPFADDKWVKSTERNASEIDAANQDGAQVAVAGDSSLAAVLEELVLAAMNAESVAASACDKDDDTAARKRLNDARSAAIAFYTHPPADAESTRAKFERWVSKRWGFSTGRWADSGEYHSSNTREWWQCWCAAIDAARDGEGA